MARPRIIALTGRAQAGKDSVRTTLERSHGYTGIAFADPIRTLRACFLKLVGAPLAYSADDSLKQAVIPGLGVSRRHIEQTLGTEWGRNTIRDDLWLYVLQQHITTQLERYPSIKFVISDLRFLNEAAALKEMGAEIWRIERPDNNAVPLVHQSETEMANIVHDRVISNNAGLAELWATVNDIMWEARRAG